MIRHYELLYVLKPTLTEEEVKARFDQVNSILETNGCEVKFVNEMGVRKLAYPIDKHERGTYFVLYFVGAPAVMDEILRNLRYMEDVLRFLNVKFETKKEVASWEKMAKATVKSAPKATAAPVVTEEAPAAKEETPAPVVTEEAPAPVATEEAPEAKKED